MPQARRYDPVAGSPPAISAELTAFAGRVVEQLCQQAGGLAEPLRSPVLDLAERPGKCLRPTLLAASARLGSADADRLVRLGALVELVHLASLLHDDVIDRAPVRRGAPAAHMVVGNEMAMLAGLACFALAGMEAADLGEGVDRVVSRTVAGLAYGEMLDVERAFDTRLALRDYLELVERKTGDLFRLACLLGAAEAQAERDEARAVAQFGAQLGVAFQILDDCLDLAPEREGKPVGTDHLLGLFGAPTLCALRQDRSGELAALLLSPQLSAQDMPSVRSLVVALGGLATAHQLAQQCYDRALSTLDELSGHEARTGLRATAELVWRGPG